MTTNNHPAHGPVSLDRLHQISEILSNAAAQSDGGNLGYAMADAVKVIDGVLKSIAREQVRREHAAWSQATFGDVGPVGPLKHLSKEALETAAEPGNLSNGLTCGSCYGMRKVVPVSVMSRLPRQ